MAADTWLQEHRADVYSQTGEDGVIRKLLEVLPETDRWCVEFGAWDGLHLSNTRHLIEALGYSAVLIEGGAPKFAELRRNYASRPNVIPIHAFVGFAAEDGLDAILSRTPIPLSFDFLSIDIDGNDYHVWKAVSRYRPKAVCVEFNPTIPTEVSFVQPADPSIAQGSSLAALVALGKEKGYELVCVLDWNAFFVLAEYFPRFNIGNNAPAALRTDTSAVTQIFIGFDGTVFLRGGKQMLWHAMPLSEARVQHLPSALRKMPTRYNVFEKAAFYAYRRLANYLRG